MSTDTALVIIDVQIGVFEPAYRKEETLANINILRSQAYASGTPVIYIQHHSPPEYDLGIGTPGWHIQPEVTPRDGDKVIHKASPDAFHDTSLQETLQSYGSEHLIIVGGQTEYCVDTTTRRATSYGYNVTLVSDAHTTIDCEHLSAAQIVAHHNFVLDRFQAGDALVHVKPTVEVVF
jgi:nicotinamidase-related amidase